MPILAGVAFAGVARFVCRSRLRPRKSRVWSRKSYFVDFTSKDLVIAIEKKRVHVMPTHSPVLGFLLVRTATHAKSLEALGLCATESLPRVDWHHKGYRVTFGQ